MPPSKDMKKRADVRSRLRRHARWAAPLFAVIAGALWVMAPLDEGSEAAATFTVFQGPMEITVLEGGSIESLENVLIQCEVQGTTKILSLVEEGYYITPEDVAAGMVLVELDATQLHESKTERELDYQNALASLTEAREAYEIQRNQNESDIRAAELDAKFALMDFQKYMGAAAAREIIARAGLPMLSATFEEAAELEVFMSALGVTPAVEDGEPEGEPAGEEDAAPERTAKVRPAIDFSAYASPDILQDGEAGQRLRKLEDDLVLSRQEVGLAETQLEGTRRLFEKEFVTRNDLDNDEMRLRRNRINMESAATSKDLFIRYEFPKQAEKLLSDYEEALRKLVRAGKLAISRIAQAEAKLHSAEARFDLQRRKLQETIEQIEKCVIRATTPGLVVYGTGNERPWDNQRIEEGAQVRERQVLITIPNPNAMAVDVKVHEAYVKRVRMNQAARVRVDANRDQLLMGRVVRIGVLPDSQNRWMNPDLKVYSTKIALDNAPDWLKPGMSAMVEILVERIDQAVQVPLQAVHGNGGARMVYVASLTGSEPRPVRTGVFNDSFVQILGGVEAGETVLLIAPKSGDEDEQDAEQEGEAEEEPGLDEGVEPERGAPPDARPPRRQAGVEPAAAQGDAV